ncbi:MAG: 50S ribosomal protein L21 [Candidatus Sungbacteria bacterium RIFCSPHIGHO2_01_FULL_47_32]|uniref:Large ribosomal subunit protein bL21 n=1 Tax=Candidatus Sungbacteria bacterium RIFCSPHIGHO2_01_FULL_47_32 TaxID=1802264 RepID=A0A1G2K5X0_9BACT|nr:MAG: 50S ribosomal protein L21 [Parcubacteria group bacterium GW2011_GWA2_47_10]OGZ94839.1 MAG: 50S ribosomal protein L21 [Candidatus Sungbacteria bacterium RIFCSPHIGHO2_01_FULL_47_32]
MEKFAVIKSGGKQYLVHPGQKVRVEKLDAKEGDTFEFSDVLLVAEGANVTLGVPKANAKVSARVLKQARADKKIVFRYHPKTRFHKMKGHRQPYTEVLIEKIS